MPYLIRKWEIDPGQGGDKRRRKINSVAYVAEFDNGEHCEVLWPVHARILPVYSQDDIWWRSVLGEQKCH